MEEKKLDKDINVRSKMEEKKLTDEEIVKALECCIKGVTVSNCAECPLDMIEEDCCYYTPTLIDRYALDLIHRLQKENEELKSPKFASWKLKFFNLKEEFDKELAEHEEFTKKANAEIERLTEELDLANETIDHNNKRYEKVSIERQKALDRVDYLEDALLEKIRRNEELITVIKQAEQQAVKDTAKEIFTELYKKHTEVYNQYVFKKDSDYDDLETNAIINFSDSLYFEITKYFKEKYGVEVE